MRAVVIPRRAAAAPAPAEPAASDIGVSPANDDPPRGIVVAFWLRFAGSFLACASVFGALVAWLFGLPG
jgi:hypothetical protein